MSLQSVTDLNRSQLKSFLDSFDNVLCDCDGVVRIGHDPIPGVRETISALRKQGKKVRFVTNNSALGIKNLHNALNHFGYEVDLEDLVLPSAAIISHLKAIKFTKEMFVLGTNILRKDFRDAGFVVTDCGTNCIEESYAGLLQNVQDNKEIGAVIFDLDINLTYINLIKASVYLQRPDVLFITGATDKTIPVGASTLLIGPGSFQDILKNLTNKEPLKFGKPSLHLKNHITEKYGIRDPKRTLFVGDSLEQDMGFASECGYQKLLVLTGVSSLEQAKENTNKDQAPDCYINSFGALYEVIKNNL